DQHIGGFRRDDELDGLEAVGDERHPETVAGGAPPVEEAALLLRLQVGFEDRLVFGRQRRLLALAPWLGGVEGQRPGEIATPRPLPPSPSPVLVFVPPPPPRPRPPSSRAPLPAAQLSAPMRRSCFDKAWLSSLVRAPLICGLTGSPGRATSG